MFNSGAQTYVSVALSNITHKENCCISGRPNNQSFQQRVGHACSIWMHEQLSTLKRNTAVGCRLEPVFPSHVNHGPYHCTTSLLWQNDSTKDLKFKDRTKVSGFKAKARTKDCNFVLKDNQGPRPRTTSLHFSLPELVSFRYCVTSVVLFIYYEQSSRVWMVGNTVSKIAHIVPLVEGS